MTHQFGQVGGWAELTLISQSWDVTAETVRSRDALLRYRWRTQLNFHLTLETGILRAAGHSCCRNLGNTNRLIPASFAWSNRLHFEKEADSTSLVAFSVLNSITSTTSNRIHEPHHFSQAGLYSYSTTVKRA
ncbi:unnamed protein product [Protopolystoma xenopodis]|uniref:Uncharacterized protein n=1 Tax=Protopolystoma xenopodis TaxID=117903 RepID=A0A448WJW3_9PLAT|nr:unnamed protein product [Protopolystoma xenopodis]